MDGHFIQGLLGTLHLLVLIFSPLSFLSWFVYWVISSCGFLMDSICLVVLFLSQLCNAHNADMFQIKTLMVLCIYLSLSDRSMIVSRLRLSLQLSSSEYS